MANPYHPELRAIRWLPRFSFGPRMTRMMRRAKMKGVDPGPGVRVDEIVITPTVSVRLFRPARSGHAVPALLWMHGGGHVMGSPEQDDRTSVAFVRELGIAVAAVRYRLGADAPAPASVEDCFDALTGLIDRADELGIDPGRMAIGGASAGGGVAAALTQAAHDRGIPIALQLLVYPMLDDRTVTRTDLDARHMRMWSPQSNRFGWTTYLRVEPGAAVVPEYAVPARREDLTGLPPAWIGVGTLDLFHDEDIDYARRLREAGVAVDLHIVPGAFHGFDPLFPKTAVVREFWQRQADALRRAGVVGTP